MVNFPRSLKHIFFLWVIKDYNYNGSIFILPASQLLRLDIF